MLRFTLYPLYRLRRIILLTLGLLVAAFVLTAALADPSSGWRVPHVSGAMLAAIVTLLLAVWLFLPHAALGALQFIAAFGIIIVFLNIRDRIEAMGPPGAPLPEDLALLSNLVFGLGIALVLALSYIGLLARVLPKSTGPKLSTLFVPDLSPEECRAIMRPEPETRRGNVSCDAMEPDGWIPCSLHLRAPIDWSGAIHDVTYDYRVRLISDEPDHFTLEVDQPNFPDNTYTLRLAPEGQGCRITTRHEVFIPPLARAAFWLTDGAPDQLIAHFDIWRGGRNPAIATRPIRALFHPLWRPIGWAVAKVFPPK
ncbi:MAG: hypothetical protein AAFQ06_07510, partial [Pseudomonadota bacterium]